ncbi:MAG TPA: acyltransferase [Bryobacteraceae bacterium]|nr:acyltransferase [Bryobacteraceae bacterium]
MQEQKSLLEQAPKTSAARFYRPELDVLRFFAFFSVFVAHLIRIPVDPHAPGWKLKCIALYNLARDSGAFGMCIFFLLSSYLITELLLRERASTGSIHLKAFYTRRILRIWPLYFGVVFASYFIGLVLPQYSLSMAWVLAFVFLAGNWYTGRMDYGPPTMGVLWSISLEEQFYLLWPGIAKFWGKRALALVAWGTIPLSLGVLFYYAARGEPMQPFLWTNSFVQFAFFGIGALLVLALPGEPPSIPLALRPVLLSGGVLLWLVANYWGHVNGLYYERHPYSMCVGFAMVMIGCTAIFLSLLGAPQRVLPSSLIYLGKISYGLYVFHVPCREIALALIGHARHAPILVPVLQMALTIGVATLSYYYFEKPFLRLKEKFEFVPSRRT